MNGKPIVHGVFGLRVIYRGPHDRWPKVLADELATRNYFYHLNLQLVQEEPVNLIYSCLVHENYISRCGQ